MRSKQRCRGVCLAAHEGVHVRRCTVNAQMDVDPDRHDTIVLSASGLRQPQLSFRGFRRMVEDAHLADSASLLRSFSMILLII